MKDLIALARNTGKVSYSSPGVGNTLHLAAELFNVRTGIKMLHVPYKGVAPAMNAVIAGEVQTTFMPATIVAAHGQGGKAESDRLHRVGALVRNAGASDDARAGRRQPRVDRVVARLVRPARTPPAVLVAAARGTCISAANPAVARS